MNFCKYVVPLLCFSIVSLYAPTYTAQTPTKTKKIKKKKTASEQPLPSPAPAPQKTPPTPIPIPPIPVPQEQSSDFDFDAQPSQEQPKTTTPSTGNDDFDIDFTQEPRKPVQEATEQETSAQPAQVGLPLNVPYMGTIMLMPFTDPTTKTKGFKAKFADATKKITVGALVIDDGTITLIGNKLGITGRATIFGKRALFGLKEASFAQKMSVQKAVLGVTYATAPTLELLPGKTVTLKDTDIIFEHNKPVTLQAHIDLFNQNVTAAFELSSQAVNGLLTLEQTPLVNLIAQVDGTPLAAGIIKDAQITINNMWSSTAQQPLQAALKGTVDLSTPPPAATKTAVSTTSIDFDFEETPATSAQTTVPEKQPLKNIAFDATIAREGITATLNANTLALKNIGVVHNALITLDTTQRASTIRLTGQLDFDVAAIGTLPIAVDSLITQDGVQFSGTVPTQVTYADFSLQDFTAQFNTRTKTVALTGNITAQGLALVATLTLAPDKNNPEKRTVLFRARSSGQEFKPFATSGIPGIETFYLTDFNASIDVQNTQGALTTQLALNGNLHLLGTSLSSVVKFVTNEQGQRGVYINAPLTKDKKLTDILPALKGPLFDGITFKQAAFMASNIDFIDHENNVSVKKGLSFLAQVPLTGSLQNAGKLMGSRNQDFTMYGTILPDSPRMSEFGILLSEGSLDTSAPFSLGNMAVALSGEPSMSVNAHVLFRPEPQQLFDLSGAFAFTESTANLQANMQGTWENPLNLQGWSVANPAVVLGMIYGSPGIPTEIGGGGHIVVKDKLDLNTYFKVDAALKNIAFEGTSTKPVSWVDMVIMAAQAWGIAIADVNIPGIAIYDLYARYAAKDTKIGNHIIKMGAAAQGKADILGTTAQLAIAADENGIQALAELDPIDIANGLFKVTGRGTDKKPKLDFSVIFLQPDKAHCTVTGKFQIAQLYSTESHFNFDKTGIEFNFEDNLGGTTFTVNGKPLLRSQVHGKSFGTLSKPDFILTIVFEHYLMDFIQELVQSTFASAQNTVTQKLQAAQDEIAKVKNVIQNSQQEIKTAQNQVQKARQALQALDTASQQTKKAFEKAQADVDTLKNEIAQLDAWYATLPKS